MLKNMSLQLKITFTVVGYVILIGVIGNIFLFSYMQGIIQKKTERLDHAYIEAVQMQLQQSFEHIFSLAAICAMDQEILQLLSQKNRNKHELILDSLGIQKQINTLLQSSPVGPFIDKLILFNNQGIFAQAQGRALGEPLDRERIYQQPVFTRFMADNMTWAGAFGPSISTMNRQDCYILLFRVTSSYRNIPDAFLYMETGIDIITEILRNYQAPPGVFLHIPASGQVIRQDSAHLAKPAPGEFGYIPLDAEFPLRFKQDGRKFWIDRIVLGKGMIVLYHQAEITSLASSDRGVLYIILGTIFVSLLAAVWLVIILSMFITRPIHLLIERIRKISAENDFSHDPEIEKSGDEIGRIGCAINEMSGSIGRFLVEMEKQYLQQKNSEIALLQTQINPHFLYNTLDSIKWMATIQNNQAIANMLHRFTSLLRSIVAHTNPDAGNASGMKITLAEELLIIEDYTELMSLRFMGSFEVITKIPDAFLDCRIPGLTLQPLVENAIIHGIRPSEKFGVITLNAIGADNYLDITVEDSGIGMSREKLKLIKSGVREKKRDSPSLNNIGIANVDERLKLLYGGSCGLFYESREGYTKATVRIIMEK